MPAAVGNGDGAVDAVSDVMCVCSWVMRAVIPSMPGIADHSSRTLTNTCLIGGCTRWLRPRRNPIVARHGRDPFAQLLLRQAVPVPKLNASGHRKEGVSNSGSRLSSADRCARSCLRALLLSFPRFDGAATAPRRRVGPACPSDDRLGITMADRVPSVMWRL